MTAPHRTTPLSRQLRRAAITWLLGVAAVLLAATPAAAHDRLVSSDPADGARPGTAPKSITLEFSGDLQQVGATVDLVAADGSPVALDTPSTQGSTLTSDVTGDVAAGEHTVTWKVVSADNHPISGSFAFDVDDDNASGATSTPTTDGQTAAESEPAQETSTTAPETTTAGGTDVAGVPGSTAMTTVAVVTGGVAVAGGLLLLLHRRRRH